MANTEQPRRGARKSQPISSNGRIGGLVCLTIGAFTSAQRSRVHFLTALGTRSRRSSSTWLVCTLSSPLSSDDEIDNQKCTYCRACFQAIDAGPPHRNSLAGLLAEILAKFCKVNRHRILATSQRSVASVYRFPRLTGQQVNAANNKVSQPLRLFRRLSSCFTR